MSAETALRKLLEGTVIEYEKLKFSSEDKKIHPLILITTAAFELGWDIQLQKSESGDEEVEGIAVGTENYFNKLAASYQPQG